MTQLSLLLIDDDQNFTGDMVSLSRGVFDLTCAGTGEEGLAKLRTTQPDAMILDLRLGKGMNGLEVLRQVKRIAPDLPVIMLTDYASVETAVEAMKLGAYHYASKSPNVRELLIILEKELERVRWKLELREERRKTHGPMIGESPAMQKVWDQIKRVAPTDSTALIMGESGVGKELVAREIHLHSPRADKPFVVVNASNMSTNLFESEFFGHEAGAFTGAVRRKKGWFETADGGILFVDEVATLPLESQAKVLRAIEEKTFARLGGTEMLHADVRVLSATNRDLKKAVEEEAFREDLYYRLNVVPIFVPPLRKRKTDIPLLVEHYLKKFCVEMRKPLLQVTTRAMKRLQNYSWPGNVRELKHTVERLVIYAQSDVVDEGDLDFLWQPAGGRSYEDTFPLSYEEAKRKVLWEFQRAYVSAAVERNQGNMTRAAQEMGIPRETLYRMMRGFREGKE